jgi:hypothetical protein
MLVSVPSVTYTSGTPRRVAVHTGSRSSPIGGYIVIDPVPDVIPNPRYGEFVDISRAEEKETELTIVGRLING